jgi:hypothetical protein
MNYRSVVVLGHAIPVEDRDEKLRALTAFTDHIIQGRWDTVRPVQDNELKQTAVLRVPLTEFSAKVRVGPPKDEAEDYALPIWAGVLPLRLTPGEPVPDPKLPAGVPLPENVKNYSR